MISLKQVTEFARKIQEAKRTVPRDPNQLGLMPGDGIFPDIYTLTVVVDGNEDHDVDTTDAIEGEEAAWYIAQNVWDNIDPDDYTEPDAPEEVSIAVRIKDRHGNIIGEIDEEDVGYGR
jgi:hypothetical protein